MLQDCNFWLGIHVSIGSHCKNKFFILTKKIFHIQLIILISSNWMTKFIQMKKLKIVTTKQFYQLDKKLISISLKNEFCFVSKWKFCFCSTLDIIEYNVALFGCLCLWLYFSWSRMWNTLPYYIAHAKSVNSFKTLACEYLHCKNKIFILREHLSKQKFIFQTDRNFIKLIKLFFFVTFSFQ